MPSERQYVSTQRTAFHDPAGEEILRKVEAHWRSLRNGNDVPHRVDLTPGAVADGLSHCFMLGRVTPSVARFRVAGQAIHALLKMEPRGMPLSALFTPAGRQMLAPIIHDVCETPEISEVPLVAPRGMGRAPLRARLLLLPMRHDVEGINRILGALVVDGRPGRKALRFEFDQEGTVRSESTQPIIRTVHEIMSVPNVTLHPAAPPLQQANSVPTLAPIKGFGLRLVVDNS